MICYIKDMAKVHVVFEWPSYVQDFNTYYIVVKNLIVNYIK
jgi:hypothetical protein